MKFALACVAAALGLAAAEQPIRFSHKIHAGDNKLECIFCHSGARRSAVAGIPSVQFCMGCHRMVAAGKPEIVRLRGYWEKQAPVRWTKVVKQPDYVFFNHAPHIARGVRCQHCHGPVETMREVRLHQTLSMDLCVDCHRRNKVSTDCYTCHR